MIALPYHPDFLRRLEKYTGWRKRSWPGTPPGQQRDWEIKGSGLLPLSTSSFVACICSAAQGFKIGSFVFTIGGRSSPPAKKTAILNLAVIGIVRIGLDRPVSRTLRRVELKIPEVHIPAEISGTKLGSRILYGRGHGKRRNKGDRKKSRRQHRLLAAAPQCRYQNVCCKRQHRRFLHITRNRVQNLLTVST